MHWNRSGPLSSVTGPAGSDDMGCIVEVYVFFTVIGGGNLSTALDVWELKIRGAFGTRVRTFEFTSESSVTLSSTWSHSTQMKELRTFV